MTGQLPDTLALYAKLKKDGFEVLGVSHDESAKIAESTARQKKMTWRHLWDDKQQDHPHGRTFLVRALPTTVLFDRAGRLRALGPRGLALEKRIRELLKEPAPSPAPH